jgi:hypothetical protein
MKKLALFLTLLFSITLTSQSFEVTQDGLKDAQDLDKEYLVLNFENKNAQELYNKTIRYINETYKNPEEVIVGNIENEFVKFKTYQSNFARFKNGFVKIPWSINYTTTISFKDNKVKYEINSIDITNKENNNLYFSGGGISFYIFKSRNGKLKMEDAKIGIENYFNENLNTFEVYVKDDTASDDW